MRELDRTQKPAPIKSSEIMGLLKLLGDSDAYLACHGRWRRVAHKLEKLGYAEWKGEAFGSSFWAITDAGRVTVSSGVSNMTKDGNTQ